MGLFGSRKDWNVIAIIFERRDMYRINGNRGQGSVAVKTRDGAKHHDRTIFWAVFDQNGAFLEGDTGKATVHVPQETVERLRRELPKLKDIREVLAALESGQSKRLARKLTWNGYPE